MQPGGARLGRVSGRRVLVTGAGGFIGANLVRRLLEEGHEVTALVRPGSDDWRLAGLSEAVRMGRVDLTDHERVPPMLRKVRPEWVFHLAAHGAYSWQQDVRRIMQTNAIGTVSLLDACAKIGCEAFVHAGTSSEYGAKDHAAREEEELEPNSAYAVSKASATLYCSHVGRAGRVGTATLRLYSVYGPHEAPPRLIPQLIVRGRSGELPPLVGPDVAHDFVAGDDVVHAFLLAAEHVGREPGAIYNIGTGIQTRVRDVVAVARRALSIAAEPEWGSLPERNWDTTTWVANVGKAARVLEWTPRVSLEQGFARTVEWLESTPEVWERYGIDG